MKANYDYLTAHCEEVVNEDFSREFWKEVCSMKGCIPSDVNTFVYYECETREFDDAMYVALMNTGQMEFATSLFDLEDDEFYEIIRKMGERCAKLFCEDMDGHLEHILDSPKKEGSEKHAIRRKKNIFKAIRKRNITRMVYWDGCEWYDNLHEYSKNKVHCSCPMCSQKTNRKALRKRGFGRRYKKEQDMWEREPQRIYAEDGSLRFVIPGIPNKNGLFSYGETNHRKKKNWSISDKRKIERMESLEADWENA